LLPGNVAYSISGRYTVFPEGLSTPEKVLLAGKPSFEVRQLNVGSIITAGGSFSPQKGFRIRLNADILVNRTSLTPAKSRVGGSNSQT